MSKGPVTQLFINFGRGREKYLLYKLFKPLTSKSPVYNIYNMIPRNAINVSVSSLFIRRLTTLYLYIGTPHIKRIFVIIIYETNNIRQSINI